MVLTPDPDDLSDGCPNCGGYMEEMTTNPVSYSGRCEVYRVCEECGLEVLVGQDGVL